MTANHTDVQDAPACHLAQVTICKRPYDHPDAVRMVRALFDEQVDRYGYADPAEADPARYTPPSGLFLVGYADKAPVACGGYWTYDPRSRTIEIKKMYTVPAIRGTGIGRRILNELEHHAAVSGALHSILETGVRNTTALALYISAGYQPRKRYATGYRDPKINRAFVKSLPSES